MTYNDSARREERLFASVETPTLRFTPPTFAHFCRHMSRRACAVPVVARLIAALLVLQLQAIVAAESNVEVLSRGARGLRGPSGASPLYRCAGQEKAHLAPHPSVPATGNLEHRWTGVPTRRLLYKKLCSTAATNSAQHRCVCCWDLQTHWQCTTLPVGATIILQVDHWTVAYRSRRRPRALV